MEQKYCKISSGSHCFPVEWFMFQNIRSSMTLKLLSGRFSNNSVDIALRAIVVFQDYHDDGLGF